MISVKIPPSDIVYFQTILELDENKFSEVLDAVNLLSINSTIEELGKLLQKTSVPTNSKLARFIITLIYSLANILSEENDHVFKAFYDAYIEEGGANVEESFFVNRITTLFEKCESIRNSYEVSNAKELTSNIVQKIESSVNVAPVFSKIKNELLANVIWNQISFDYTEDGEEKSLTLNFDRKRLIELKEYIKKLENQTGLLSTKFLDGGFNVVE